MPIRISPNLIILHLTVIVWGFTGIIGNLITVSSIHLVWYRCLIAFASLLLYLVFSRTHLAVSRKRLVQFLLTGGLVGLHWILFFQSIRLSTVSVTLVCLSSVTLFTSLLEPLFYKRRISLLEVLTGILVIVGIYLIFKFEGRYFNGIILGLIAAFVASFFSIFNSKLIKHSKAPIISFYEMLGAFVWITLYLLFANGLSATALRLQGHDLWFLLLLGTVCTSGAYVAAVAVMKELSAFRVALVSNLEPIYGIILAYVIFGQAEVMSLGFYFGALLILGAVFSYPLVRIRLERRNLARRSL